MKKNIIILIVLLLSVVSGCQRKTEEIVVEEEVEVIEEVQEEEYNLLYFESEETIWGADPGLGIDVLHKLGYKGKGSIIAYADGKMDYQKHDQLKDADIVYEDFPTNRHTNEWHGNGVASLILGKDIGTAPETKLYYFGYEPLNDDQTPIADVIYEVIRVNETLPDDQKISMLGFSNNIYNVGPSRKNQQVAIDAAKACRDAGIMIFFCGENGALYYEHGSNRNDPENCYLVPGWEFMLNNSELSAVPAANRTVAYPGNAYFYDDEKSPGMSWTQPFTIGLYAIAVSIDPTLTENDIRNLNVSTAFVNSRGMRIINPCEFIAQVLERVNRDEEANVIREEYKKSLENYDEDKYSKLMLDPSLKPERGVIIEKRLHPNHDLYVSAKTTKASNVYYNDIDYSGEFIFKSLIKKDNDDNHLFDLTLALEKGMKCKVYDYDDSKNFSTSLKKTTGEEQKYIIEIPNDKYENINTLVLEFTKKDDKFYVYIDIYKYLNPDFYEINEDIIFPEIRYSYDAKNDNEIDYEYDPSLLDKNLFKIYSLTYTSDENNYHIYVDILCNNDTPIYCCNLPNGEIFVKTNRLKAMKRKNVDFVVNKENLKASERLGISAGTSDNDRMFIYLKVEDFK